MSPKMKGFLLWLALLVIAVLAYGLADYVRNKTQGKKGLSWAGRIVGGFLKAIAHIIGFFL